MDFEDEPEEAAFRAECRAFLTEHALPKGHPEDFSEGRWLASIDEDVFMARARAWMGTVHEHGWAGVTWPAEYGGRGGTSMHGVIYNQEEASFGVSRGPFLVALTMVGPTIMAHGTEAQKERFLGPILRGEEMWCQLFSEPEAGSDLAALRTKAVADGDEYVITGQKVWTSSADQAQFGILLARTDPDASKHAGITYFLVDMAAPGIDIRPLRQITGEAHFNEVFLDEVRVPADAAVGGVNGGWRPALTTLGAERAMIGGRARHGEIERVVELARRAGRAGDPTFRQEVVRCHVERELLRFLGYRTQTALSRGSAPGAEASIMKLLYARHARRLGDLSIAVQGMAGVTSDASSTDGGGWETKFLHSLSLGIAGGTNEVQRNIVGERVLGLPREPRPDKDVPFRELTA